MRPRGSLDGPSRLGVIAGLALAAACVPERSQASTTPPRLEVEAPPALAAARARVEALDPQALADVVRLTGLADPGPAIRVVLASEDSGLARQVPPWTAGFALGEAGVVVVFPARAPVYPHHSLEDLLRHEIAHVLIARAAGGRPVPRWFHEGLALAAERPWGLSDRSRLVYELTLGVRVGLDELDSLFARERRQQARAYSLAGAFVRDLLAEHGREAPGEILARVGRGAPFGVAFAQVTGVVLPEAEEAFWNRQRFWTTWVPFLTSSAAVWMLMTLLALYAIHRRRQKSAALRRKWALEDGELPESWPDERWPDGTWRSGEWPGQDRPQ